MEFVLLRVCDENCRGGLPQSLRELWTQRELILPPASAPTHAHTHTKRIFGEFWGVLRKLLAVQAVKAATAQPTQTLLQVCCSNVFCGRRAWTSSGQRFSCSKILQPSPLLPQKPQCENLMTLSQMLSKFVKNNVKLSTGAAVLSLDNLKQQHCPNKKNTGF